MKHPYRLLFSDDAFVRSDASEALLDRDPTNLRLWNHLLADESSLVRMDAAVAFRDPRLEISADHLIGVLDAEDDEFVRSLLWVTLALRYPERLPVRDPDTIDTWLELDGYCLAALLVGRAEGWSILAGIFASAYAPELSMLAGDVHSYRRDLPLVPENADARRVAIEAMATYLHTAEGKEHEVAIPKVEKLLRWCRKTSRTDRPERGGKR